VLLNTYKAEFGHSAGANIEIVSRAAARTTTAAATGTAAATRGTRFRENRAGGDRQAEQKIDTAGIQHRRAGEIPGWTQAGDKGLFFFYSMERRRCRKPAQVRLYPHATGSERRATSRRPSTQRPVDVRQGSAVELRVQRDRRPGAGCFPGNVIPANRLDPNALGC